MAGALIGLLAGLLEAARLYFVPRPPLLFADVRPVIWFLAPLADLLTGAVMGVALSPLVLALALQRRVLRGIALAVYAGLAAWLLYEGRAGRMVLPFPWPWSAATLVFAVWTAYYWRRRLLSFLDGDRRPYHLALGATLLGSVALSLAGIAAFNRQTDFAPPRPILGSIAGSVAGPALPARQPNVVLITLDTVRGDHLSLYGYPRPTTPNLDRWAKRGVVFDNAIAPSSWTLASHASMFTGLLPHQHGANWFVPMDAARWTLAEILRAYGYETFGFSSNPDFGEGGWGIGQGFQTYDDVSVSAWHNLRVTWAGNRLLEPIFYSMVRPDSFDRIPASRVNRNVFARLRQRTGRPFFLFINYFDAHGPYLAPPPYQAPFGEASDALLRKAWPLLDDWDPAIRLSPGERESLISGYDNCLAYLDAEVGGLLELLAGQPEWSTTVVIITSDHGEAFGEHGTYSHGVNLYREVLRVPLVMFGPGIPAGLRIARAVTVRNLFDTVLDLTIEPVQAIHSSSLRRFWEPGFKPGPFDDCAISELAAPGRALPGYVSLTTSEWQYIRDSGGYEELYRWATSPQETDNLAASLPEEAATLRTLLSERIGSSLGPWAERRYLLALPPSGVHGAKATDADSTALPVLGPLDRIGAAQAYFPQRTSRLARRTPPDEELLRSLPYH